MQLQLPILVLAISVNIYKVEVLINEIYHLHCSKEVEVANYQHNTSQKDIIFLAEKLHLNLDTGLLSDNRSIFKVASRKEFNSSSPFIGNLINITAEIGLMFSSKEGAMFHRAVS